MEATTGSSETTLRLSVVVPTGGDWGDLAEVVASLLPAVETLGVEVVAVSGCGGRPAAPVPGVRYLAEPEPDVFRGRAAAVAVATGDVVALVEDHQRVHPGWAPALCGPTRRRAPSKVSNEPPPAATVWMASMGARMRTPATWVSNARSNWPA